MRVIGASSGSLPGQFVQPRVLCASADGRLFVIDNTGRVQRFDTAGRFEKQWRLPPAPPATGKPSGMGIDSQGRVYVADTHQHRVLVFDADGHELRRFGEYGTEDGQFLLPTDVALDRDGCVYVGEYGGNDRITKFDDEARFLLSFGGPLTPVELQRPSGLSFDEHNRLWVADTGNHRLCCFDTNGELLSTIGELGSGPGQLRYPRDVVVLSGGQLAAADQGNDRVVFLDFDGTYLGGWGSPGRGLQQMDTPLNIAAVGSTVFVADSKNNRVLARTWNPAEEPQARPGKRRTR